MNNLHLDQFNAHLISKVLTEENIENKIDTEFRVKTKNIYVEPDYVINALTGEIILEIEKNDSILDYLDYLKAIEKETAIENEQCKEI